MRASTSMLEAMSRDTHFRARCTLFLLNVTLAMTFVIAQPVSAIAQCDNCLLMAGGWPTPNTNTFTFGSSVPSNSPLRAATVHGGASWNATDLSGFTEGSGGVGVEIVPDIPGVNAEYCYPTHPCANGNPNGVIKVSQSYVSSSQLPGTMSHEFGHVRGLADFTSSTSCTDSIMAHYRDRTVVQSPTEADICWLGYSEEGCPDKGCPPPYEPSQEWLRRNGKLKIQGGGVK